MLYVFNHVRDRQWERNQKMGDANFQRIEMQSNSHHVREDMHGQARRR